MITKHVMNVRIIRDVQIAAAVDNNVLVTWWQVNSTGEEPVARVSTNDGQTFEPLLNLVGQWDYHPH